MIKNLFVLVNLASLILFNSFFAESVSVLQEIPDTMEKGSTHTVTLTITKGNLSNFAKLQQTLPEGITAVAKETQGASFTFSDGKVKFIWMSLPPEESFSISYDITIGGTTPLNFNLDGKFSYIEDNERKTYDIPRQEITIEDQSIAGEEEEEAAPPATATCSRTITQTGENEYTIEINIAKEGVTGFAKIQDYLPEGVDAVVIENNLAVFSTVDDKAKFVWMSIPEDDPLQVSYKVTSENPIETDLLEMTGEFSFLSNNETQKVDIEAAGAIAGGEQLAENSGEEEAPDDAENMTAEQSGEEGEDEQVASEVASDAAAQAAKAAEEARLAEEQAKREEEARLAAEQQAAEEEAKRQRELAEAEAQKQKEMESQSLEEGDDEVQESEVVASNNDQNNVTSTPDPETGISYKVQILAGHNRVDGTHIEKKYQFTEVFKVEQHEGWIKYTVGSYPVYKGARDSRNQISDSYNFPGPFVTAYNNGERITVQEALMISNQKWFK